MSEQYDTCGHCGAADVGSPAAGRGTAVDGTPLCHPNVQGRPVCFALVTRWQHAMPCATCTSLIAAYRVEKAAGKALSDPGDGRVECEVCGKWVWVTIHSCKGVPLTARARGRRARNVKPL